MKIDALLGHPLIKEELVKILADHETNIEIGKMMIKSGFHIRNFPKASKVAVIRYLVATCFTEAQMFFVLKDAGLSDVKVSLLEQPKDKIGKFATILCCKIIGPLILNADGIPCTIDD